MQLLAGAVTLTVGWISAPVCGLCVSPKKGGRRSASMYVRVRVVSELRDGTPPVQKVFVSLVGTFCFR